MHPQGFIAYELKGESLEAAIELDVRIRTLLAQNPIPHKDRPLVDVYKEYNARYRAAVNDIRRDDPALAARCGLLHPVTQVDAQDGAHPRAYQVYPEIFHTSAKAALYLIYCPVGYDGKHFVPADAVECTENDLTGSEMGHSFYKGMYWISEAPVLDPGSAGVALPADFDPATAHTVPANGPRPQHCFRAGGDALYTLDLMAREKDAFEKAWKAFSNGLHEWAQENHPGHYVNMSMRTRDGQNVLEISLRQRETGTPVELKSPDWVIVKQIDRQWLNPNTGLTETVKTQEYEAHPDTTTENGRALYLLFKNVPRMPLTQQHADVEINVGGRAFRPIVYRTPQGIYLAYNNIPEGEIVTPPAGCVAVPAAEVIWLDRDRRDREWGITPPPPPASLAHLFKAPQPPAPRAPQP